MGEIRRCEWCCDGGLLQKYHDEEWGDILHDDKRHFEYLLMEVMQCGLSWLLMLKKRESFKSAFNNFDFYGIAKFNDEMMEKALNTEGMIKSMRKVKAIVNNATCFINIIQEFGSFDKYLWSFSDNKTIIYRSHQEGKLEASNELSDAISRDMKKRGFKYLGSITIYSHLQACGIINDHDTSCWKYEKILKEGNIEYR